MHIPFVAALLLAATAAQVQEAISDPSCANVRASVPPELAAWAGQAPVAAGTEAGGGAIIRPGEAVRVSLHPANHLKLNPAPKVLGPNGGTLTLAISAPGTYRLALGGRSWLNVIRNGTVTPSSARSNGPKCSGIRKMVDYVLNPGQYTIQLSGSEAESVTLLAVRVP